MYISDFEVRDAEHSAPDIAGVDVIGYCADAITAAVRIVRPMALTDAIAAMNFNDLIEFDKDARLVRKKIFQSDVVVCELVCYEPGQFTKPHVHPNQDEIFFCMEGMGIITFVEKDDIPIRKGSVVFVPRGTEHGVDTIDGQRLVVVFTKGPGLPNPSRGPQRKPLEQQDG